MRNQVRQWVATMCILRGYEWHPDSQIWWDDLVTSPGYHVGYLLYHHGEKKQAQEVCDAVNAKFPGATLFVASAAKGVPA